MDISIILGSITFIAAFITALLAPKSFQPYTHQINIEPKLKLVLIGIWRTFILLVGLRALVTVLFRLNMFSSNIERNLGSWINSLLLISFMCMSVGWLVVRRRS